MSIHYLHAYGPKLFFKSKPYKMIRIKVKYRLTDEGEYNICDDIEPLEYS